MARTIRVKEGADAFKVVRCREKVGGRKASIWKVGIDEDICIPGTEHDAHQHRVYDLPLQMHNPPGVVSREGTINRVVRVETPGKDDVVIKIPLSDGIMNRRRVVEARHEVEKKIERLVPAAKLLKVEWLKGVKYHGIGDGNNPDGIPVEFHEHVNDKNLLQERLSEDEFHSAIKQIGEYTAKLLSRSIIYDVGKPENFCRDKNTSVVKVIDKNGSSLRAREATGNGDPEVRKREAQLVGEQLANCFMQLYLANALAKRPEGGIVPLYEDPERVLRKGVNLLNYTINESNLTKKDKAKMLEGLQSQIAKTLQEEKGVSSLFDFPAN